jgi:glycosyltransferase involved in cell wall biosynthesis
VKTNYLISVIVPVYNAEKYLTKCIESILGQTYPNIELLLINDGSTDGSPAICDEYALKDKRVKVIHKKNEGVSSARNMGLELAQGDFISFVDADDWLERDAIERIVESIQKYDCDAVIFEYKVVDENNLKQHKNHAHLQGVMSAEKAVECTISPVSRFVWSKVLSRKILEGIKFDNSIHFGEDTLFACEALSNAKSVYYMAEPVYNYYQSSDSATRMDFNPRLFSGVTAYKKLVEFTQLKYPAIVDVAQSAYKNLVVNVLKILMRNKNYAEFNHKKKELKKEVMSGLFLLLFSKKISLRFKLKFVTGAYFPVLLSKM